MIKVFIKSSSRYPISRKRIKAVVEEVLGNDERTAKDIEISIFITGTRKMKQLTWRYLKKDKIANVLSFPLKGVKSPDGVLRLGDIVICYPEALKEASQENVTVDEVIDRFIKHGLLSLLGLED